MKMISLLLLILSSCLCATFVVNVTQSSYEAEENQNITLDWTFTSRPEPYRYIKISCDLTREIEGISHGVDLIELSNGVELPDHQDDQFSGRVQIDKDVLREGRIRLQVSRLRTEDSGLYLCDVKTEDGFNSGRCRLSVTAAADQIQTQRPTLTPEPEEGWIIIVIIVLGVTSAAALMFALCYLVVKCCPPVYVYYSDDKETRDFSPLIDGNTLTNMREM